MMDGQNASMSCTSIEEQEAHPSVYIFFEMEINWSSFRALETRIVHFVERGASEINLVMSSGGGCCTAAVTCFNFLKSLDIKIKTYNTGDVNSAAILPFMAGTERYCVGSGRFLFHPLSFEANGSFTINEYQDIIKNMKTDLYRIAEIYTSVIGITQQKAHEMLEREHWVDAYAAKELGLVTRIAPLQIGKGALIEILPLP